MTADEKLAAILAAVQTDPGNRGLARDPHDNLFTATIGDFETACRMLASDATAVLDIVTGFYIPAADPPAYETDGPLGAVFLARALSPLKVPMSILTEHACQKAVASGLHTAGVRLTTTSVDFGGWQLSCVGGDGFGMRRLSDPTFYRLALERVGPAGDGRCYNMRGRDITDLGGPAHEVFTLGKLGGRCAGTIGIGDGGNEIGMGKIPHETIVKNIPNGDLIHCRVPTDHLIVAGVSNWGAYALAAGLYVCRGRKPAPDLFDPDRERTILEVMVREGPLVDGVTGKQTATVDGLTWEEYAQPLVRIREILES